MMGKQQTLHLSPDLFSHPLRYRRRLCLRTSVKDIETQYFVLNWGIVI